MDSALTAHDSPKVPSTSPLRMGTLSTPPPPVGFFLARIFRSGSVSRHTPEAVTNGEEDRHRPLHKGPGIATDGTAGPA